MTPSNRSKTARFWRSTSGLVLGALLAGFACSEPQTQDITGETHFLTFCRPEAGDCGEGLSCLCGVCTRICALSSDCSTYPSADCTESTRSLTPEACEGAAPPRHCDVTCGSDADCGVLSNSYRCDFGHCRAGSGTGGASSTGGTGGTGGTDSGGTDSGGTDSGGTDSGGTGGDGAGGDDMGMAGADACVPGEVEGNQVVVLGDTFMAFTHEITAGVEELARAAGALPAGQRYRDESTRLNNALALNGNGILGQYERAFGEASVGVVIMNGGGADVLNGSCEDPPLATCPALTAAVAGAQDLFARTAVDGVSHVIYAFYPDPMDATVRDKMDVIRPLLQAVCEESPTPCHFLDLRPVFEGRYAEYIAADGLNPTAAGSLAAADAIWATMQEYCVAQ